MSGHGITPLWDKARSSCQIRNEYVREAMAEFLGTGILCLFSTGAGIQGHYLGDFGGIFGLMTAILIVGGVSGGHVNPAVTLGLAIGGQVSWFKVPVFWIAQFFGGYIGSLLGALVYYSESKEYKENNNCEVFSNTGGTTKVGTGIADQIVMTAVFMMAIYSLIDKRNMGVPKHLVPFLLSLVVGAIGWTFGKNAGAPVNPARDLSPRFAALTLGCDTGLVMRNDLDQEWWVVGLFGPLIGASVGAFVYILAIGAHLDDDEESGDTMKAMGPEYMPTRFMPAAQPGPQMSNLPRGGAMNQGYEGTSSRERGGY